MKINNLYEIHFSPTGGTKEVVETFGEQWNIARSVIDLADMDNEFDKYEFYNDDLCIIGVPSYGGRVPAVVVQRLRQMRANNTSVIIIATYGNRTYEDTLVELQEVVEELGFCVVIAIAAITRHAIVPSIAHDRPDVVDKAKLAEMSLKVKAYIERAVGFNSAKLPGAGKPRKEYKNFAIKPSNIGKCINCGICAANCPVGAIPLDNPRLTDTEKCITCMRCVRRCPKSSRKLSEMKLAILTTRLKKETGFRREIEIFVNKNVVKDVSEIQIKKSIYEPGSIDNLNNLNNLNVKHEELENTVDENVIQENLNNTVNEDTIQENLNDTVEENITQEDIQNVTKENVSNEEIDGEQPVRQLTREEIQQYIELQKKKMLEEGYVPPKKDETKPEPELEPEPVPKEEEELEPYEQMEWFLFEAEPDFLDEVVADELEDIKTTTYEEPEEIEVPENMQGVDYEAMESNSMYEEEDLLENYQVEPGMELHEIESHIEEVEDIEVHYAFELSDIEEKGKVYDSNEGVEEVEDNIGVVLEDK